MNGLGLRDSGPGVGSIDFRGSPDASNGRIGAYVGVIGGGVGSAVSSVGSNFTADRDGGLRITLYTKVWGIGSVASVLFGYASASADLRIYVERYAPTASFHSQFSQRLYGNSGILVADITRIGDYTYEDRIITTNISVSSGVTYRIFADAVQHAAAGGFGSATSNFAIYVQRIAADLI